MTDGQIKAAMESTDRIEEGLENLNHVCAENDDLQTVYIARSVINQHWPHELKIIRKALIEKQGHPILIKGVRAEADVIQERDKQRKKWGDDHDDGHGDRKLAEVAGRLACRYAWSNPKPPFATVGADEWGLEERHDERERLVIAAALLIAEIERLDRESARNQTPPLCIYCGTEMSEIAAMNDEHGRMRWQAMCNSVKCGALGPRAENRPAAVEAARKINHESE